MNTEILRLLAKNAKYTPAQLAKMTGADTAAVKADIEELEKAGYIRGYKTIIDWDKSENPLVSAIVELKVIPNAASGFEDVAQRVAAFPEVESVYLMSGAYDLNVVVKGKTLQAVANFVARELATIDAVTSTSTHFVMRRYKEMDVRLLENEPDERGQFWL